MLTSELKVEIDEKWDACWPLSKLKPIAILDLISYLFFFKKISGTKSLDEPKEKISWNSFRKLGVQEMHTVFTEKNGVLDLMGKYDETETYGAFLKSDLFLKPTPKSLSNAAGILKIMETEDDDTKAEIINYLLNKTEIKAKNGQTWLPGYIVTLMVSIIHPEITDIILDPSTGNGSLLAGCSRYIVNKNRTYSNNFKKNFEFKRFTGFESDVTNLRIGAMNMILNGLDISSLKARDTGPPFNLITTEPPTVFISDLLFSFSENKIVDEGGFIKEAKRNEITSLDFILKNAEPGSRVAVTVPSVILYHIGDEIKTLRRQIIENCKLEAVIALNDKALSQFAGAAILIFHKETSAVTDKIWFYKLKHANSINKEGTVDENNFQNNGGNVSKEREELQMILSHFTDGNNDESNIEGFYIGADKIKSNNYNLSYNEYNMERRQKISALSKTVNSEKNVEDNYIKKQPSFVTVETKMVPVKNKYSKKFIKVMAASIAVICIAFLAYLFLKPKKEFVAETNPALVSATGKDSAKDSSLKNNDATAGTVTKNNEESAAVQNIRATKYTVISKAYFYSAPEENARQDDYINHWSNVVLTPEKEKDGFVYVVYIKNPGQKLKGWLNKKDLEPLH